MGQYKLSAARQSETYSGLGLTKACRRRLTAYASASSRARRRSHGTERGPEGQSLWGASTRHGRGHQRFSLVLTIFLYKVLIEANPQTGPFAEVQRASFEASTLGIEVGPQGVALGVVERFHRQAVRGGCHQVAVNLGIVVRGNVDMIHAAHTGDLAPFSDPTVLR